MITIEVESPEEFVQRCSCKDKCREFGVDIPQDCKTHCNQYHNYLWQRVREVLNGVGVNRCPEESQRNAFLEHSVDTLEL